MEAKDLLEARLRFGINQTEAAIKLGISYPTYSTYENKGKIPATKFELLQKFIDESIEFAKKGSVKEENAVYKTFNAKSDLDSKLDLIFGELQAIRKENEQLKNTIAHFIEDNEKERKLNELSRTQFGLAVDVMKSLDRDVENLEKSSSTKHNISKTK